MSRQVNAGLTDAELQLLWSRTYVISRDEKVPYGSDEATEEIGALRRAAKEWLENAPQDRLELPTKERLDAMASAIAEFGYKRRKMQGRLPQSTTRPEAPPPTDKELVGFVKRTVEEMKMPDLNRRYFVACRRAKRRFRLEGTVANIQERVNEILTDMRRRTEEQGAALKEEVGF